MKCKNCGKEQGKYPLFEGKPFKSKFIWQNLFKMEWAQFFMVVGVVLLVLGTKVLLDETTEIQKHPCDFCEKNGCCSQPLHCYTNSSREVYPVANEDNIILTS